MYTLEAMTNCSPWENILNVMTTELKGPEATWTSVGGCRSHYYNPALRAPIQVPSVRITVKKAAKKKVIWARVLLPVIALGCFFAYQANQNAESQYRADVQDVYSRLAH